MKLEKYSFGIGDRFGFEGKAQLRAMIEAKKAGVTITPVWNKSFREHQIVGTEPLSTRQEADEAVKTLNWTGSYFVDADHVNLGNIEGFIDCSDFFTIDVADYIGRKAHDDEIADFLDRNQELVKKINLPVLNQSIEISREQLSKSAEKYLFAVKKANEIYRYLREKKQGDFVVEVSMDETDSPQSPSEMVMILAGLAAEEIPVETIAPKFIGEFFKGIDYVGDVDQFSREFEEHVAVVEWAKRELGVSPSLKLSVHSGSDKFSIYPKMRRAISKFDAGIHVKTAGTTWLEEVIGLADAGGEGLTLAKRIYALAIERIDELSRPYAPVIRIDRSQLPAKSEVNGWSSEKFVKTLQHNVKNESYNPHFRQLIHISYKIAAEMGEEYFAALRNYRESVEKNVTHNILENHLKPLFLS